MGATMTDRPLRIAIWTAVSSKPQATSDKTSLPEQEQRGREFADTLGGQVVALYTVPGHSRNYVLWSDIERDIPAYRELREACEAQTFDVLHAVDADRLGRTSSIISQVIGVVEEIGAGEVYLASSPHQIGHKSVAHRYISAIQGVRSDEDQANRVHRHRSGMRGRVKRGLPANHLPIGYTPIRDDAGHVTGAEFDEDAIGAVRLATKLFLQGQSYNSIVRSLNASRWKAPIAARWAISTIIQMLRNDTYAGLVKWGQYVPGVQSDKFPALWDAETHAQVIRARLARKHAVGRRTQGRWYGIAFCARCGAQMVRATYHGHHVLRCGTHCRAHLTGDRCHANNIHEADVMLAALTYIDALLAADPGVLATLFTVDESAQDVRDSLEDVERRVEAVNVRRRRVALAFADGTMDAGMYRATDDGLLADLDRLEQVRVDLRQRIEAVPSAADRAAVLDELRSQRGGLLALEPLEYNAALLRLGVQVEVDGGAVVRVSVC